MSYGQVGLAAQSYQNQNFFNEPSSFIIQPVRVHFTFLDMEYVKRTYPKLYEKYGGYDALNGILFDSFTYPIVPNPELPFEDNLVSNYSFAKPLFPNRRHIPILEEVTYVIVLPSVASQNPRNIDLNQPEYYYFFPINLWNTSHQNALPDPLIEYNAQTAPQPKNISYKRVEAGATINSDAPSPEISLGDTFKQRNNIKYLTPYEGDVIHEGRWGQSIRFGSTVLGKNPWSQVGTNGDPILILRNGQASSSTEAWVPTFEKINEDLGSIYFGSTQKLPLDASSTNYNSYKSSNAPTVPNQYNQNQIMITSGRLVFNSSLDHILLSSNKSINLNAQESINIDADTTVIESGKVYLGSKDADQPLLLGNETVSILNQLINNLKIFMNICATTTGLPQLAPLNGIAQTIGNNLASIQKELDKIKSKDTFTT